MSSCRPATASPAAPQCPLKDLVDEPLVLLGLPQSRDYFLSIFYGLGLQPRVAHETPSFEMVRGLVANGHGYSVMHSRPVSEQALDGMRLVYRPVAEKIRPTQLGIVRRREGRPSPPHGHRLRRFLQGVPEHRQPDERRRRQASRSGRVGGRRARSSRRGAAETRHSLAEYDTPATSPLRKDLMAARPLVEPGLRLLQLRRQLQQRRLVAELGREMHADRQAPPSTSARASTSPAGR